MLIGKPIHDLEKIKTLLEYNAETGLFTWKVNRKGNAKSGMIAGWHHKQGYTSIRVDGHEYLAHRLAWAFQYSFIPENMQIDHINGDRQDNRIENLRLVSHAENCQNSKVRKHSKSGVKGVKKRGNKWHVRIQGKWVGSFDTVEQASAAYRKAAFQNFGTFAKK